MNLAERFIVWTIALGMLYGCVEAVKPIVLPDPKTNESLTKISVRNEDAASHVEQAKPHSDEIGKVHLAAATDDLKLQAGDVTAAQTQLQIERDGYKKIIDGEEAAKNSRENYYNVWYRKLAIQFVNSAHWIFWIIIGSAAAVIVLRVLSTGPFALTDLGAVFSGAATAIAFIASSVAGPLFHGLQWLFDNIHFRRALKAQAATPANAAKLSVVAPPASVVGAGAVSGVQI